MPRLIFNIVLAMIALPVYGLEILKDTHSLGGEGKFVVEYVLLAPDERAFAERQGYLRKDEGTQNVAATRVIENLYDKNDKLIACSPNESGKPLYFLVGRFSGYQVLAGGLKDDYFYMLIDWKNGGRYSSYKFVMYEFKDGKIDRKGKIISIGRDQELQGPFCDKMELVSHDKEGNVEVKITKAGKTENLKRKYEPLPGKPKSTP